MMTVKAPETPQSGVEAETVHIRDDNSGRPITDFDQVSVWHKRLPSPISRSGVRIKFLTSIAGSGAAETRRKVRKEKPDQRRCHRELLVWTTRRSRTLRGALAFVDAAQAAGFKSPRNRCLYGIRPSKIDARSNVSSIGKVLSTFSTELVLSSCRSAVRKQFVFRSADSNILHKHLFSARV
jgi:hypothetical protein